MINVSVIGVGYWGPNLIRNFVANPHTHIKKCSDLKEDSLDYIRSIYPSLETTIDNQKLSFGTSQDASFYFDTLPAEDFYFYVIIASDGFRNSSHSNCEYVQYALPSLSEFVIKTSLILSMSILVIVFSTVHKKKRKLD